MGYAMWGKLIQAQAETILIKSARVAVGLKNNIRLKLRLRLKQVFVVQVVLARGLRGPGLRGSSVLSFLFLGASPECVHKVEGSKVLAHQNSLLHGEKAAETRHIHEEQMLTWHVTDSAPNST